MLWRQVEPMTADGVADHPEDKAMADQGVEIIKAAVRG